MRVRRVALLAVLLAPAPASAYVFDLTDRGEPKRWARPCVTIVVETGTLAGGTLSRERAVAAVRAAAAAWDRTQLDCSALSISVQVASGERSIVPLNDGVTRVFFRRPRLCRDDATSFECTSSRTVAYTNTLARKSDGRIVSADIEINTVDFTFDDLMASPDSAADFDLQGVLTHEIGHLLGLAHTCHDEGERSRTDHRGAPTPACATASDEILMTTMSAVESSRSIGRRALAEDDVAGICALYPAASSAPVCSGAVGDLDGGCNAGRVRPRAMPWLLTLLYAWISKTRATRRAGSASTACTPCC